MSMSSSSSSSNSAASLSPQDHLPPSSSPSDQLCYVHCNICDTVLAVSVPCSSLLKTVTVRCGHCTTLLPVNMRGLLLPPPSPNQLHYLPHNFFSPPNITHPHLMKEITNQAPNFMINQANLINDFTLSARAGSGLLDHHELPRSPLIHRAPEKRQRVPSAYNRFIKDEIQRIKAGNPDISHREAFSAAAKNWAHFPHIHFGLMPSADQTSIKKTSAAVRQQDNAEDMQMKDAFFASANNIGISPY